jgi:hypothetical protein
MHHGHHRHHHGGPGGLLRFRRPFPNREELLTRLESYQRDLEQELADVEDVIRHLRGTPAEGPAQPTAQA